MTEAVKKTRGFQVRLPTLERESYTKESLYLMYKKPIAVQAARYVKNAPDVEDVMQNVFVKVLRNWHKLIPKNAGGWLALILQNEITDHFKRERNRPSKPVEGEYDSDMDEILHDGGFNNPASIMELEESMDRINAAMRLFKRERDRDIFLDKEYFGLSSKEVMEKYGIKNEGGVNEKVFRLRKAIKLKCGPGDFVPSARAESGADYLSEQSLSVDDVYHGIPDR